MPIYEFKCLKCGREFEELVLKRDEAVVCPSCGEPGCEKWMSACRTRTSGGDWIGDFGSSGSVGGGCAGCAASSCAGCGVSR